MGAGTGIGVGAGLGVGVGVRVWNQGLAGYWLGVSKCYPDAGQLVRGQRSVAITSLAITFSVLDMFSALGMGTAGFCNRIKMETVFAGDKVVFGRVVFGGRSAR